MNLLAAITVAIVAGFAFGQPSNDPLASNSSHTENLAFGEVLLSTLNSSTASLDAAIDFLRAKGVLGNNERFDAELEFSRLRNPSNSVFYTKCQERLLRLHSTVLSKQEQHADSPPAGAHLFTDAEFPGYTWMHAGNNIKTLVQRQQKSGLCYMHACVIVQYDAIWNTLHRSGIMDSDHGVLDVALYISEQFSAEQLEKYIFDDTGGSSHQFLETILEPGSRIFAIDSSTTDPTRFSEYLTLYGPALVSNFKVTEDFKNESIHHHHGVPTGKLVGMHAMVLLDTRTDADGNRFYLLQNWCVSPAMQRSPVS